MSWGLAIGGLALVGAWIGLGLLGLAARGATVRPGREGEFETGVIVALFRLVARRVHTLRIEGRHNLDAAIAAHRAGRPIVLAPNHTAGIDPVLVQASLPPGVEATWMMAEDMRIPWLDALWRFCGIIFVDRSRPTPTATRSGLRVLRAGGVLGVFPEGHIERPPRTILPFREGFGVLSKRAGALVVPILIDDTPQTKTAWGSLLRPSRSVLRYLEPIDAALFDADGAALARTVRERFLRETGWPASERTPILGGGVRILVDLDGRYYDEATGRVVPEEEGEAIRERLARVVVGSPGRGKDAET